MNRPVMKYVILPLLALYIAINVVSDVWYWAGCTCEIFVDK